MVKILGMAVIATASLLMGNSYESTTIDFAQVDSVSSNLALCDMGFALICETKCISH